MRATEEGENKLVEITFLNSKTLIPEKFTKFKKKITKIYYKVLILKIS